MRPLIKTFCHLLAKQLQALYCSENLYYSYLYCKTGISNQSFPLILDAKMPSLGQGYAQLGIFDGNEVTLVTFSQTLLFISRKTNQFVMS